MQIWKTIEGWGVSANKHMRERLLLDERFRQFIDIKNFTMVLYLMSWYMSDLYIKYRMHIVQVRESIL